MTSREEIVLKLTEANIDKIACLSASQNQTSTVNTLAKEYIESCTVTFSQYKDSCFLKVHSSKNLKELSEVLQEMTLQQL